MKGYTIKINVTNIDKVSSTDSIVYNLTKVTKNGEKENKIFTLKKGIFKNTYKANLKFDSADSDKNSNIVAKYNSTDFNKDESSTNKDNWDTLTNSTSNLDLSFKVNIPYSAISNNATQTSNNNKELVWSLSSNEASNIEFEFSLYNRNNIIIISVVLTLIIIVVVISIINNKKKNSAGTYTNDENNIEKLDINIPNENNNDIKNTQTIDEYLEKTTSIESDITTKLKPQDEIEKLDITNNQNNINK